MAFAITVVWSDDFPQKHAANSRNKPVNTSPFNIVTNFPSWNDDNHLSLSGSLSLSARDANDPPAIERILDSSLHFYISSINISSYYFHVVCASFSFLPLLRSSIVFHYYFYALSSFFNYNMSYLSRAVTPP